MFEFWFYFCCLGSDSCSSSVGCTMVYVGIFDIIGTFQNASIPEQTTSISFSDNTKCSASFCDDCEVAFKVVLAMVSLSFFSCLPGVISNTIRLLSSTGNNEIMKRTSISTSIFATLFATIAVSVFVVNCNNQIIAWYNDNDAIHVSWKYGPSFA